MTENRWLPIDGDWSPPIITEKATIEALLRPFMREAGLNNRRDVCIAASHADQGSVEATLLDGLLIELCPVSADHDLLIEHFPDIPTEDDFLLLKATLENDDRLAGALMVMAHHGYRLEDLIRGLMASLSHRLLDGTGQIALIQSSHPLMSSDRQPNIMPARPPAWSSTTGLFTCSNPTCSSRQAPILVKIQNETVEPNAIGATVYPCPRCPGDTRAAWALSFQEYVTAKEMNQLMSVHEIVYVAPLLSKRISLKDGPISVTATLPRPSVDWRDIWNPYDVPQVPETAINMHEWSDVNRAFYEINENLELRRWMSVLLSSNNLKALVQRIRQELSKNKSDQLAEALALIFDPRRQPSFRNDDDQLESHPYISLTPSRFKELMHQYGQLDNVGTFLDIGSGIGDKLFLAYSLGQFESVVGLEFNKQNIGVANYLMQSISEGDTQYPISSVLGDALLFENYGDFDCIYMYRPFRDKGLMASLIGRIAEQMKPGAIAFDGIGGAMCFRKTEKRLELFDGSTKEFRPSESIDEILLAFDVHDSTIEQLEGAE